MKKFFFLLLLTASLNTAFSQDSSKYVNAMAATLQQFGTAKTTEDFAATAAKFQRIAEAEKTKWLPYYYAALIKARMGIENMGDADKLADEADTLINKAQALNTNSENYCVVSMIATARVLVDPQNRYMIYLPQSEAAITNAIKADATNPRPYALQAAGTQKTPEAFGGGCGAAKPIAQKALAMYDNFKPASPLHPNWGKELVDEILKECK
jgi:hypothetical protein